MSIDKTWINNPNKLSDEYATGVLAFVERARLFVDETGLVKCPCNKCVNIQLQKIDVLEHHLFNNGFLLTYTNWYWHGEEEKIPTNKAVQQCQGDEIMEGLNDIEQPKINKDDENDCDDDMPTYEDYDSYDDSCWDRYTGEENECNDEVERYYTNLFAEMEAPLFPGCEKYTSFNFLIKLMHFKVLGKIPTTIFDELLELLQDAFPAPNKLPKSYREAKMLLSTLGPARIPQTWLTTHRMDDKGVMKDAKDNYEILMCLLETRSQYLANHTAVEEDITSCSSGAKYSTETVFPPPQITHAELKKMMERIKALEELAAKLPPKV
ncbi:hypothetical protein CsatB_028538 [Cannabis sativa]